MVKSFTVTTVGRCHQAPVFDSTRDGNLRARPYQSFAVVTDQKLQGWIKIWITQGHIFLCLSPDLVHKGITLAYFVFLEELSLACSQL